jgi:hypothetical protein
VAAAQYDLTIEAGATFTKVFRWRNAEGDPIDLTGYTARMQIRETYASPTPLVSLTTGSGITLEAADGVVNVEITADQTAALAARRGVYDLELEDASGFVTRLVEGKVTIRPEVTR